MMQIDIDAEDVRRFADALGDYPQRARQQVATAIGRTSRKAVSLVAKDITQYLAVTQKVVKESIGKPGRVSKDNLNAHVTVRYGRRLSLKRFSPRKKKTGVSYRVSKKKGKETVLGAFMGPNSKTIAPRLGGHVFKRLGKARKPIAKLHGASPWGVIVANRRKGPLEQAIRRELKAQVDKSVRDLEFKKQGSN